MSERSLLTEIRLPAFKSVRDSVLPLANLTLLVGRNGSGKSNVLDGLWTLSQLATGSDIRDLLDGGRDGPTVRGGAEGCAPIGEDSFALGCSVRCDGFSVHLDVRVKVYPVVQISHEELWMTWSTPRGKSRSRVLLKSDPPDPHSADIAARWDNGKRGSNPALTFRATQLLTAQVPARLPTSTQAARDVTRAANLLLEALRGVFVLDPVPHAMRQYVPARDNRLRRQADNISAVLSRMLEDETTNERLLDTVQSLSESRVVALGTVTSTLDDVMLAQTERVGREDVIVPARLMSDGTLRVLAVLAALFEVPVTDVAFDSGESPPSSSAQTTLVIEEIENGLHPSQAAAMVARVRAESIDRHLRTVATTHSPAMLDALVGEDHEGLVICARDEEGWTRLQRLVDLPNYFNVVAGGTLGWAATTDRLRPVAHAPIAQAALDELLGLK